MCQYFKSTITLNYTCNNKCFWCYARNAVDLVMKKEDVEKCIDTISALDINHCQLIGGEPLVYPYIVDVVKKLNLLNISVNIATNGRRLADEVFFC